MQNLGIRRRAAMRDSVRWLKNLAAPDAANLRGHQSAR